MMMRMLGAGGLPLLCDGRRPADAGNPHGYFELEAVKHIGRDHSWLDAAVGRAVKVVEPLLLQLPLDRSFRIVRMRRDLGEVFASQARLLERLGSAPEEAPGLRSAFERLGRRVDRFLAAHPERLRVLEVDYREVLADPEAAARRLAGFAGPGLDARAMARAVERPSG